MKIGVFGLGYVGCVSAACLVRRGHEVVGVDVNPVKIDLISSGKAPVVEERIGELTAEAVARGALRATTDAREAVAASAEEVAYILRHAGVSGMVAEGSLVDTANHALALAELDDVPRARISGGAHDESGWEEVTDWIDEPGDVSAPDVLVADDDPLRLMYTSGTESRPKGVMLSSRSLLRSTSRVRSTAA